MTRGARAAVAMARLIHRRYAVRPERAPLSLVFRRAPIPVVMEHVIVQRPRLELTVRVDARGERIDPAIVLAARTFVPTRGAVGTRPDRVARQREAPARAVARPLPAAQLGLPQVRRSLPASVAEGATARETGHVPRPSDERAVSQPTAPSASPARVFRQTVRVDPSPQAVKAPALTTEAPSHRTTRRNADASATIAPSVDIRHITDQVIRAIDQRITAQRERMGRP